MVSGQKLYLGTGVAPLYPGVAQTVNQHTFKRLVPSSETSRYIRVSNSPTVYLVDKGKKHAVANPNLLRAWAVGATPPVNIVSAGYASLIPDGEPLTSYLGESAAGGLYIMDGRKIPVPSQLKSSYQIGGTYLASDTLLNLQPNSSQAKPLLKSFNQPHVYAMEEGKRRHITNPTDFGLWSGTDNSNVTNVSSYVSDSFSLNGAISGYIADNSGNNYIVNGQTKLPVSVAAATDWGLSNPSAVAGSTISRLATGGNLPADKAKVGNNYYLVESGKTLSTTDSNLAAVWQVADATVVPAPLIDKTKKEKLHRFVRSSDANDKRIFIIDNGHLYHVANPLLVQTLGYNLAPGISAVSSERVGSMESGSITTPIVKNDNNEFYVIDNGTKRSFADNDAKDQWTDNGTLSAIALSDSWFEMFGNSQSLSKSIKGSEPAIYGVTDGVKQWVLSSGTYKAGYAPYTQTTDLLVDSLPSGPSLP